MIGDSEWIKRDYPWRFYEIHPYSKGECRGNGFKHLEKAALATCDGWHPVPASDSEGSD